MVPAAGARDVSVLLLAPAAEAVKSPGEPA